MGVVLVGCGGSAPTTGATAKGVETSVGQPVSAGTAGTVVTFATDDGVTLSGRLFGGRNSDGAGVVLAHMYPWRAWFWWVRRWEEPRR
jgi:hypothetical protein